MTTKLKAFLMGATAAGLLAAAGPAAALNIQLNPDASFAAQPNGAAALFAFQKAANYWNTVLTNNTTLVFNVSYSQLGANIIGSTGSNSVYATASSVYAGLNNNSQTALDATAVANLTPLSAAGGVNYRMPDSKTGVAGAGVGLGLETVARGSVYDTDNSANNLLLYANTANLKTLGVNYNVADTDFGNNADANITFSSAFNFDFNPTDGLANNSQDFISVAVHEMGHALGFVSGADLYDYYANAGPGASSVFGDTYDWDTQPVLSVWDLFRYSTNGPANSGFNPATGKRYIQLDPNRGAAFSIDGVNFFNQDSGNFANLATGAFNGDKSQASHWKDASGFSNAQGCFVTATQIGIMDPTSGSCQQGIVTANDLAAFDAMGYNLNFNILNNLGYTFNTSQIYNLAGLATVLPEPSTWLSLILGFGMLGGMMRRRRDVTTSVSFG